MPPTFPKLSQPVTPAEVFVAPATFDAAHGRAAVEHAVKHGLTKPADIDSVDLAEPALLYVPFWRVGSAFQKDGLVMVCARSDVPYEAKPPSLLVSPLDLSGAKAIDIGTNELVPVDASSARDALAAGEVVDADIDKARAEALMNGMLLSAVGAEPRSLASTFVLYPLYYAPYRYSGESRRHAGEELFVAVSGRTGEVAFAKHPSPVRALATKLRKLLSFDRR
jgi:hypothetical protein